MEPITGRENSITHRIRHHLTTPSLLFSSSSLTLSVSLSTGVQPADSVSSICTFTSNSLELIDSTRFPKLNTADLQLIVAANQQSRRSFN